MDHIKIAAVNPSTGEPQCPDCQAVGDQPHGADCDRGKGWAHAVKPADVQL
jgi:hypothetical protein